MKIEGIIWLTEIVEKLAFKRDVEPDEVEEVFENKPKIRFVEKGEQKGENVYLALGRTVAGRYLSVLFIYKKTKEALILSARDMADKERRQYGFFDTHDMGEYWERMPEASFDISIKRRKHLVAIDEEIVPKLNEIAKSRKISAAKLINTWLKEKLSKAS